MHDSLPASPSFFRLRRYSLVSMTVSLNRMSANSAPGITHQANQRRVHPLQPIPRCHKLPVTSLVLRAGYLSLVRSALRGEGRLHVNSRVARLACIGLGAIIGFTAGMMLSYSQSVYHAKYFPLPHHIAKHPGGVSFRFAMVHDIIHERFPRHGQAYYRERDRITQEKLAALNPDDPEAFNLTDDLAVGLERLGHPTKRRL